MTEKNSRHISPGEYCTMVRANELGILNKDMYKEKEDQAPFTRAFQDLKTFSSEVDARDHRTKSLCKETVDGKEAYPHCLTSFGPGFVKLGTQDASQPVKCETYDCPPGFKKDGNICNKEPVLEDAKIDKRGKCEERFYDWFLLPNYHLGNKFHEESVGKCYAPCPINHVPMFAEDPVDGARMDFTSANEMDKCTPRYSYFMGKYASGTDYCPMAWIMRMYHSNPLNARNLLLQERKKMLDTYGSDKPADDRATKILRDISHTDGKQILQEASFLAKEMQGYIDNVETPKGPMAQACEATHSKERLQKAFGICKALKTGSLELSTQSEWNKKQNAVLAQACNAVFCDGTSTTLDVLGETEPLCFAKPAKVDPNTKKKDGEELNDMPKDDAPPPDTATQRAFFYSTLRTFLICIVVPMVLVLFFFFWTRFAWPHVLVPLWAKLKSLFTGRKHQADVLRAKLAAQ